MSFAVPNKAPLEKSEVPAFAPPPSGEPAFWREESSLRQGLALQARVVWALMLREVRTLYGRHRLGYLWAFLEPLLHMGFWFFLMMFIRNRVFHVYDLSPFIFLATGLVAFFSFRNVASFVQGAISANTALLQFPPVKHVDTILARFLLEASTMVVVATGIFGALIFTQLASWPNDILGVISGIFAMLLLGLGFGAFSSMIVILLPAYVHFTNIINRILYFTSGLFFIPEILPPQALEILKWNPALHGTTIVRSSWSSMYESQYASYTYIFFIAAVLLLLGLLLEPLVRKIRESE
jgi:capsular polysaccharide transport system permease protein